VACKKGENYQKLPIRIVLYLLFQMTDLNILSGPQNTSTASERCFSLFPFIFQLYLDPKVRGVAIDRPPHDKRRYT
jgi:hypothetical protein